MFHQANESALEATFADTMPQWTKSIVGCVTAALTVSYRLRTGSPVKVAPKGSRKNFYVGVMMFVIG